MTANQIANRQARETARSNAARERETHRSNRAVERETGRSNRARERENYRSNTAREKEANRSNLAKEKENYRSNKASERLKGESNLLGVFSKALFNDPAWTNLDPQATKDVANISLEVPLGRVGFDPVVGKMAVPGIARVNFCPGIGVLDTNDPFGAANAAFRMIFSYIRSGNAGSTNYEANDLGIYLLAVDSPYMFIATLARCYGLINHVDSQNRYTGLKIARTMGFADEVLTQPNRLRGFINMCINQMKVFSVPRVFPLYARHTWLCSHVFKDKDTSKAQYFYYMPEYFFTYASSAGPDGSGMLRATDLQPSLTFALLENLWQGMWTSLIRDQDIAIMSGDILKKYDESQLVSLQEINEDYKIIPAYDEDALQQFHCTTLMGSPAPLCNNVYQTPDDGGLWWGANPDDIAQDLRFPGWVLSYNGHQVLGEVNNNYEKSLYFKRPMTVFCPAPWTYPTGASAYGDYGTKKYLNRRIGYEFFYESEPTNTPRVTFASSLNERQALFNLYTGRDTPEWIMEYTRNISLYANYIVPIGCNFDRSALNENSYFMCNPIATCGTEYFSTCEIFQFDAAGEMESNVIDAWDDFKVCHIVSSFHEGLIQTNGLSASNFDVMAATTYIWLSALAAYDWFPSIQWTVMNIKFDGDPAVGSGFLKVAARTTDIQNYVYLDGNILNKMNYVALQSYFGIPTMGKPNY